MASRPFLEEQVNTLAETAVFASPSGAELQQAVFGEKGAIAGEELLTKCLGAF
jgi:hypothetical protein